MNTKVQHYFLLCLITLLVSCSAPKEVLYLQDIATIKEENIDKNYEVIIHKDDLLAILVNSKDPELALPFNMPVVTFQIGAQTTTQQRLLGYLVDQNGDIDFPILGKIHVEGLTRMQVTELIKQKLMNEDLIKDPIVTVQFLNFKVSVMGEVARPGTFDISGDRITLLEALSMAGDLTIYGMRDNVKLIRTGQDNKQEIITMDLNKAETVLSPYYQLQQNDIIYVTPNKTKAKNSDIGTNTGLWFSATSILVSLANILVILLNK